MDSSGSGSRRRASWLPARPTSVTLTSELRDVAGNCADQPGTISFTTGPDNDTTAPTVTASTPYYNEADVGRRPVIRVAFSERINPDLADVELVLSLQLLHQRAGSRDDHDRSRSAERDADAGRAPRAALGTTTTTSRRSRTSPATTAAPARPTSVTGGVEDTDPPTLVSIAPANGGDGRARQRAHSRVDVRAHRCHVGVSSDSAHAGRGRHHRRVDQTTSRFSSRRPPTWRCRPAIRCRSAGCAIRPATRWRRSSARSRRARRATADTTAPTVVSFSPTNGATGVSVSSPIVMTVSEPIRSFAFANSMRVFASLPLFGTIQLAGTYTLNASGTVVTFTPQVPYPVERRSLSTRTTMERRRIWPQTRCRASARRSQLPPSRTPNRRPSSWSRRRTAPRASARQQS